MLRGLLQKALPAAVVVLSLAAPASADAWQGRHEHRLGARLDATLDRVRSQVGEPGVQAAVYRNGRLLWSAERGDAIAAPRVPVNRRTLFALGSFGKLMLSAYALDRVEAGRLQLDVPISTYLGDAVPGSEVVTPRMLLTHIAGYPDVYESAEVGPLLGSQYDPNRQWSFDLLATGIHDPVDPGERWEYSNTGYIVLAQILETITREPLEQAYQRFLWRAGLTERQVTMRRSALASRHIAHSYFGSGPAAIDSFAGATGIPTDLYGLPWGDGALAGTAAGAAQFLDALLVRGRLLCFSDVRRMVQPTPQSLAADPFGEMQGYGMGTAGYSADARLWHGHDGSYVGFTAMGATDLKRGVTIAVAANRQLPGQQPSIVLWRALAEAYGDGRG